MEENEEKKAGKGLSTFAKVLIIIVIIALCLCAFVAAIMASGKFFNEEAEVKPEETSTVVPNKVEKKEFEAVKHKKDNLHDLDLEFLKLENKKEENLIYSPLSIKYALLMLKDGADGESLKQLNKLLNDVKVSTYESNENMSLANALFIKSDVSEELSENYKNIIHNTYDGLVTEDTFESPDNINKWIEEKTLKLIPEMLDSIDPDMVFALVNALGIDMEWENKFIPQYAAEFNEEYAHEAFYWGCDENVVPAKFNKDQIVSGMTVKASVNKYDIVKDLGEENIEKTFKTAYQEYLDELAEMNSEYIDDVESIDEAWATYIKGLKENYGKTKETTDFSFYVDEDVKVFAKDLKKYNGTTLEYVGIMPLKKDLNSFIDGMTTKKLQEYVAKAEPLTKENAEEGTITKVQGFIPKFTFDYEIDLMNDLKELGVTDIFDEEKADLSKIGIKDTYVGVMAHKATIEFTQDGIKAAAATMVGGLGGGSPFDYIFAVPVKIIDLTFDKPYMFIIIDKDTNDVWFTGKVFEPLKWEEDPESENFGEIDEYQLDLYRFDNNGTEYTGKMY